MRYDPNEHEPKQEFGLVDAGLYRAMITDTDWRSTRSGGHMLTLQFQIMDGQFAGRCLRTNLNLDNANPKAQAIAESELALICRCIGLDRAIEIDADSPGVELRNKTLIIKVGVQARKDTGQDQNVIFFYEPLGSGPQAAASAGRAQEARAAAAASAARDYDDDLPF